jgi:GDP-L-fucose synthase
MNILVTGNTGFVGRHLVRRLRGKTLYFANSSVNNLISPLPSNAFDVKFDCIYHLAAFASAGVFPLQHKADLWERNQLINSHIFTYWLRHQPQATLATLGTSCAYPLGIPLVESNYGLGPVDPDMLGYASSKIALLHGLQCAAEQYGLRFKYLIPGTICGDDFAEHDNHFCFDFVRKIHRGVKHDEPVVFWGDGSQRRQIVDVSDVVELLIYSEVFNRPANVTNGREYPLGIYAGIVADEMGYKGEIQWDSSQWCGNLSKRLLGSLFSGYGFRTEDQSLREAARWYKERIA